MLRFFFRSLGSWGFGKIVSLISPLRKFTLGLAIAMWLGLLICLAGIAILWFYPTTWFGENILDLFGTIISLFTGTLAYAAFRVKNFQDKKVEELSDIGHQQFSKVYAAVKEKFGTEEDEELLEEKIEASDKV